MDTGKYQLVEELFLESADLPLDEQDRFLRWACADLVVLAEVRSLLAHDGPAAGLLTTAIPVNAATLMAGLGVFGILP